MKYFETVYLVPVGSETVKHENARQTAFYSPLIQSETQDLVTIGKPIHASYHCVVYWKSLLHTHSWKQTGIMHRGDDQCILVDEIIDPDGLNSLVDYAERIPAWFPWIILSVSSNETHVVMLCYNVCIHH